MLKFVAFAARYFETMLTYPFKLFKFLPSSLKTSWNELPSKAKTKMWYLLFTDS